MFDEDEPETVEDEEEEDEADGVELTFRGDGKADKKLGETLGDEPDRAAVAT